MSKQLFVNTCCSDLQNKKGTILQASVDYIKRLKKEQLAMSELVAQQEELQKTNRQLVLDIQVKHLFEQSFRQQLCAVSVGIKSCLVLMTVLLQISLNAVQYP